jgi:hypothetical protein
MTQNGSSENRIRAFHEAGHCWGLWTIRRRFRYTTLRPRTAGFDGLTVLHRKWDFDEAYPLAVVAVSGLLAELIYRRSQTDDQGPEAEAAHLAGIAAGGHDDVPKARMLLDDSEKLSELSNSMHAHWAGISLVAEELLEHSTLSGRRVFAILDGTEPGVAETPC